MEDNETAKRSAEDAPTLSVRMPAEPVSSPSPVEASTPAAGGGAPAEEGGDAGTGAPRKKRRRGKRGGKRHKKKPAQPGAEAGEEAASAGDGDESSSPAAKRPQPQRQRKPQSPRPRPAPKDPAGAEAADVQVGPSEDAAGPSEEASDADGSTTGAGTGTARRRRRRRRKPSAGASGSASSSESDDGEPAAAKPRPKQQKTTEKTPQPSTRLAARALRQANQSRTRRPRRRLTEEDVQALRGGAKTMLVHQHDDRTQIAVLEEGVLIEHYVAHKGRTTFAGNIYLGRVQNVLAGMEAAFVDFGRGRNGVLYAGEVNYSPEDLEAPAGPRIEKALRTGQAILVQVTKDPIGTKGARLTSQVSLAGRYLVLAPEQQLSGISRRLAEPERNRLRQILRDIAPKEHGVIVRTAAEGATREAIAADLQTLLKTWTEVQTARKKAKAPAPLYEEPELIMKVVRDIFSGDFEKVKVDSRAQYEELKAYLTEAAPDLLERLELHTGPLPLFESHRVTEQLHKALERKVWLPSGGSLVIDRTEAMTVIDVNTGKFTGKGSSLEDTVYHNNVEAAEEVARQLRLRDIGGIIMIDFIDMIDPKHQVEVLRTLKRALAKDKTRSQVFDFSNLGVVEMTRKKVSEGLLDAFSEPCPNCQGRGIVITHEID